jgi:hypothetical protein
MVCIFDPACELLPPWTKELYGTCVLLVSLSFFVHGLEHLKVNAEVATVQDSIPASSDTMKSEGRLGLNKRNPENTRQHTVHRKRLSQICFCACEV